MPTPPIKKSSWLFFIFLFPHIVFGQFCHFLPPQNWQYAQLPSSPYVKAGFVGKAKGWSRPSLTLSTEDLDVTPEEYLSSVKKLYHDKQQTEVRDLGKISTISGPAYLLEISTSQNTYETRTLQMIYTTKTKAFILTGTVPKDEFLLYSPLLLKSFASFSFINNYYDLIQELPRKKSLQALVEKTVDTLKNCSKKTKREKELLALGQKIEKQFPELGAYSTLEILKTSIGRP